jgi:hypothetical protein
MLMAKGMGVSLKTEDGTFWGQTIEPLTVRIYVI